MTDLSFTINNHDYKAYVEKWNYITDKIPVTIKRTDLDGVDHSIVIRHKGYVSVVLNPISPDVAKNLFTDLANAPCQVTYFSFQDKANVTKTMIPKYDALQDAKQRTSGHWVRSFKVEFTEE